jgi:putative transposase
MKAIYGLCQMSKQAHHQALGRSRALIEKERAYVGFMLQIRHIHPGMGLRTMYEHFQPHGIGRDAFIALGLREGLRLTAASNPVRTTLSVKSRRYTNLLAGRRFTDVNQLWSSDLFYFQLGGKYYYVVLIMDVYSRRIIGYSVADNMRAENNLHALRMALNLRGVSHFDNQLIHHSDRGAQYISDDYTDLLQAYGIRISMCNEVYENAHIERANGTIKNDYLKRWDIPDEKTLFRYVPRAIHAYSNARPHQSLPQKMTPLAFEAYIKELSFEQKPILMIYTINNHFTHNPLQLEFNFG